MENAEKMRQFYALFRESSVKLKTTASGEDERGGNIRLRSKMQGNLIFLELLEECKFLSGTSKSTIGF